MADLLPVHQDIVDVLGTYLADRGALLIDGRLPDGADMPMLPGPSGAVAPHAVLLLGDPDEHPYGRALDGAANALGILPFELVCVAANPIQLTQLRDLVIRALVGHVLPDGSEISGNGGLADQAVMSLTTPQRYLRTLGFYASVGASGVSV